MNYTIIVSKQAESDLNSIYHYIAFNLANPNIADKICGNLINAMADLEFMPERFRLYDKEPWHSIGIRIMPFKNYKVIYYVDKRHKKVIIYNICNNKENFDKK